MPVTPGHRGGTPPRPTGPRRRVGHPARRPAGTTRRETGPAVSADHPSAQRRSRPPARCRCSAACRSGRSPSGPGCKRIDVLAWRDFDDPEAGGSELHAHRVITAWSEAGLDVSMTTSSVPGGRRVVRRDGYRVIRRAGRYPVFPRSILSGAVGPHRHGRRRRRDLERDAVLQPAVVPQPADHLPPPRARRDVEDGPAPGARRVGPPARAPGRPALLPAQPDRHPVALLQGGDRRAAASPARSHHRHPARGRAPVLSGRRALGDAAGAWPSDAWCRSSGSTC